jgi:hypothetical protein
VPLFLIFPIGRVYSFSLVFSLLYWLVSNPFAAQCLINKPSVFARRTPTMLFNSLHALELISLSNFLHWAAKAPRWLNTTGSTSISCWLVCAELLVVNLRHARILQSNCNIYPEDVSRCTMLSGPSLPELDALVRSGQFFGSST